MSAGQACDSTANNAAFRRKYDFISQVLREFVAVWEIKSCNFHAELVVLRSTV